MKCYQTLRKTKDTQTEEQEAKEKKKTCREAKEKEAESPQSAKKIFSLLCLYWWTNAKRWLLLWAFIYLLEHEQRWSQDMFSIERKDIQMTLATTPSVQYIKVWKVPGNQMFQ